MTRMDNIKLVENKLKNEKEIQMWKAKLDELIQNAAGTFEMPILVKNVKSDPIKEQIIKKEK